MNKIILASNSPYRREMLDQIGLPYEAISPNFEENWNKVISLEAIAKQLFIAFNPFFLIPVFQFRKYLLLN